MAAIRRALALSVISAPRAVAMRPGELAISEQTAMFEAALPEKNVLIPAPASTPDVSVSAKAATSKLSPAPKSPAPTVTVIPLPTSSLSPAA